MRSMPLEEVELIVFSGSVSPEMAAGLFSGCGGSFSLMFRYCTRKLVEHHPECISNMLPIASKCFVSRKVKYSAPYLILPFAWIQVKNGAHAKKDRPPSRWSVG